LKTRAAFIAGLLAALLAALPAALRFPAGLAVQALFVGWAACALVMAPLSAALAGAGTSRFRSAVTLGVLLAAIPLVPFASVLKSATHHRPLGGVTFAVLAGIVIIALSLFGGRLLTWSGAQAQTSAVRRALRVALVFMLAAGGAALVVALSQALKAGSAYATGIWDALRILILATLAARVRLPEPFLRRVRGLGLATWILVVTVGVCLARAPAMQAELEARCPVIHWPLLWLGG
jgi:hypothetical protein